MKVGIVGSRRFKDRAGVERLVSTLAAGDVLVSGGCRGVDSWAEKAAIRRGLSRLVFEPDLAGVRNRGEAARRYFERNRKIAEASDVLHAFVTRDRTGGTENTIMHMRELGKQIILHYEGLN